MPATFTGLADLFPQLGSYNQIFTSEEQLCIFSMYSLYLILTRPKFAVYKRNKNAHFLICTLQRHNTKNLKQIIPGEELRDYSPNSYIHVSVSDLYILLISFPIRLQESRRPRNSFPGYT